MPPRDTLFPPKRVKRINSVKKKKINEEIASLLKTELMKTSIEEQGARREVKRIAERLRLLKAKRAQFQRMIHELTKQE